jgi:hypothetical protein
LEVVNIWLREMARGHKCKAVALLTPKDSRKGKKPKREESSQTETSFTSKRPCPIIPQDAKMKTRLRKNVKKMECDKLLDVPWKWVCNEMVEEIAHKSPPPDLKETIRAQPDKWTKEVIASGLQVREKGVGLKKRSQAEPYLKYFDGEPSPPDGWRFEQCTNKEFRDVLKFLIHLMKPNKPSRLNIGPVATIADCLFGNLKVSWAAVFHEVLEKELDKMDPTWIPFCLLTWFTSTRIRKP